MLTVFGSINLDVAVRLRGPLAGRFDRRHLVGDAAGEAGDEVGRHSQWKVPKLALNDAAATSPAPRIIVAAMQYSAMIDAFADIEPFAARSPRKWWKSKVRRVNSCFPAIGSYFPLVCEPFGVPGENGRGRRATPQRQPQRLKEPVTATTGRKPSSTLYVDRFTGQWIVRDPEGEFWTVPGSENARVTQRERFFPAEQTELEPVPGHYKHMLGISN